MLNDNKLLEDVNNRLQKNKLLYIFLTNQDQNIQNRKQITIVFIERYC